MIATALAVLASILLTYLFVDRENQTAKEKISALNDTQDSKAEDVAAIKTTRFRRIAVFTALQLTLIGSLLSKQTSASSTANEAIEKYEDLKSSVLRLADASSVDSALGLLRESATSLSLNETRETAAAAYRGFLSPIADQLAAYEKTIKDLELSCRAAEGPGKIVDKILLVAFVQSTHTTTVDAQSRLPELIASHFRASDLPTLVPALPPVMMKPSSLAVLSLPILLTT